MIGIMLEHDFMIKQSICGTFVFGPPDLFRNFLQGSCDNPHETWTALLERGPGVDRARSSLLVARGMPGEPEGVPYAL